MLCNELGALYLDTCIEPWAGGYTDPVLHALATFQLRAPRVRSCHCGGLRRRADRGADAWRQSRPVSHLVKEALLNLADETGRNTKPPHNA